MRILPSFPKVAAFLAWGSLSLSLLGCPTPDNNTNNNTNSNANTNSNSTNNNNTNSNLKECSQGALCIRINNDKVRSCELLFLADKTVLSTVGFADGVIGQYKQMDKKLAIAFLTKDDKGLNKQVDAAVVRMEGGVSGLKMEKSICYNRNGQPMDDKDILQLEQP